MDAQIIACSLQMTNECLCSISPQYPPFIAVVPISCASFPCDRSSDIQVTLLYWALLTGERELCLSCNAIHRDTTSLVLPLRVTHAYQKQSIMPHHKMYLTLFICSHTFCLIGMGELTL